MLKFVTKSIIKYLIILVMSFIISIGLFLSMHVILNKYMEKNNQQYASIVTNLKALDKISSYVIGIKARIFEITAATETLVHRNNLNKEIEKDIENIIFLKKLLGSDFVDSQIFLKELYRLKKNNNVFLNNFDEREIALKNNDLKLQIIAKKIKKYNFSIPSKIENLLAHVKKSEIILNEKEREYKVIIEEGTQKFLYIVILISLIIVFITLYLSKQISQHIVTLYRRLDLSKQISQHTVTLYTRLETQLYIDDLTKLKNRFALNKTYKNVKNPFIIILNIDLFRVINELYGIDVGNEVLKRLAVMMKEYFSNTKFELFRIAGDEFVLFEEDVKYTHREIEKIILDFLNHIKENKIYIEDISESLELDFTCGVSTYKENFLEKADIALNYAKRNGLSFAVYKTDIDNKVELKDNLFWNKEIQNGIKENMFLPFFQPIVDKNGVVKKYESLMRLKKEDRKGVSFISPYKFFDIAKKTKNYNKISSMTMYKSLDICKKTGFQITINLDKNDMINSFFKKELKEKIIELDIAKKIVFEILENENIVDNDAIKKFIFDFRELGVQFAIDDFGSAYSNFSFILDIKPDFIKIDGMLIKNIVEDKNSYELVKSIVAFAKALNIITIAEFVHSKEVYDIVLGLGVDHFQGYYFGKPKEIST